MKLVILGAGASFDSIYDFFDQEENMPWRPPLANELFDTRRNFLNIIHNYPGGKYYLSQLNAINDVEDFFQKQWHFIKNNRAVDLASAFINLNYCLSGLMFMISSEYQNIGLSNYDILVQKAYEYALNKKEDVIFVSFNYDTLLEHAVSKIYFGDNRKLNIEDYIKFPLKIIKPHGSCNWVKRFFKEFQVPETQNISDFLFETKMSLREINKNIEPEIYTVDNPLGGIYYGQPNETWRCFPQILIPLKDKDDFILPESHNKYLEENIWKTSEILIIGWKGTEAKFQNLLSKSLGAKKIKVTSINAGFQQIESVLKPFIPGAEFYHFVEAFSMTKYINTKVKYSNEDHKRLIYHKQGTFSSYMLNILNKNFESFFKY